MSASPFIRLFPLPLLGTLLLVGCSRQNQAVSGEPVPLTVEVTNVTLTTDAVPVEVTGVLSRRLESTLSFKTGGVIAAVSVRPGDHVTRGQTLATLRLDEIDAQVTQARTALEKARRDHARVEALHADRVATLENLQDSKSALDIAEATLRAAEFNRTHSVIVAPADGRILRRLAEPEELAGPGRQILSFAAEEGGWIAKAGVTERDVLRLHLGDRAELKAPDGLSLAATIAQIAEGSDPATRTVEVELNLVGNVPAGLRSGFIVDTRIQPQPVPVRAALPLSAVVEGRGHAAYIFVVAADSRSVHRQEVEIEAIHDNLAYLRSPLPAGTRIVTTGAEFLSDGRAITLPATSR